jgi:hypothetical protein
MELDLVGGSCSVVAVFCVDPNYGVRDIGV